MRGVGGVGKWKHQSWLAKVLGLRLGLLYWGFKGVQEIRSEEASTLQIGGSSTRTMHQSTTPSLSQTIWPRWASKTVPQPPSSPDVAPCEFRLFPKLRGCRSETIEEMKEAVTKVIDTLTQENFHGAFQKLLERYNKWIAAGGYYFEGD